jgi:hypothetical protein
LNNNRTQLKRLPMELVRRVLIGTSLVVLAGAAPQPEPAGLQGPGPRGAWSLVPSPNTGSPNNYFFSVAAIASDDVWAVGAYGNLGVSSQQLIQHWDGTQWTRTEALHLGGASELASVSAIASDDVWAVGYGPRGALIEHWDGSAWKVVTHPRPGTFNRFLGVAATSPNDVWAVGLFGNGGLFQTLVEHWDGKSWRVVPSPNVPNQHNQLNAVTAVPGSNELWAVGAAGPSSVILHWNGTQWSLVPSPNAGINPTLTSVVAISANDVWAVGYTGGPSGVVTLTEHWDGSTWSVVPSPNPSGTYNYLRGVAALGTNNVWAVGDFNAPGGNGKTLLLQWDGVSWAQVTGDNRGPTGLAFRLDAVTAVSESDIWAVGSNSHTLAEHWNGTEWSIVATPNAGIGNNVLTGVSGTASTNVWEVGYNEFGTEKRTLIEHWNGTNWNIVPSPNSGKRTNVLNAVVGISPSNAWAVGSADSGNAFDQITLILHWNGAGWSVIPSPSPGTAGFNALYGVDGTSANDVWAVGSFMNTGGYLQTLIEHWDGTSWSVIPSANVPGVHNELYGVVALGPNNVWAVGYDGSVEFSTLIEHWDGSTWSVVSSPDPPVSSNILRAVSATGGSDIWAVGTSKNLLTFMTDELTAHWDGSAWSLAFGAGGVGSATYGIAAVSPEDAWEVGDSGGLTLIGRWNGESWSVFPGPNVAGRLRAATAITACDVWAVGQRHIANGGLRTLNEHFTCN